MEVDLVTDDTSDEESYGFDDNSNYLNFEGERCGICTDIVIDRGVLDCCQHWFCFACIDNWATITSLCPLCQNEFQLITCVPVYDTVGGNKSDDDTDSRYDDWFIEGQNNTLSFPSYYIDENAVVCLDGDGCKIRTGSVAIEGDSDIDTSIACDSCDKWYHAFCVGFDPDGPSEGSWLCPRCTNDKGIQTLDSVLELRKSYQSSMEISGGDSLAEASFSGRVSVSAADDGETHVVLSLVEGTLDDEKPSETVSEFSKYTENTLLSNSESSKLKSEPLLNGEPKSCQQDVKLCLSQSQPRICADDSVKAAVPSNEMVSSGVNVNDGLSPIRDTADVKHIDNAEDLIPGPVKQSTGSEDLISDVKHIDNAEDLVPGPVKQSTGSEDLISVENVVTSDMDVTPLNSRIADEQETRGTTGVKRKQEDIRNADDGEREANSEDEFSRKKIKTQRNVQTSILVDQTDDSSIITNRGSSRDNKVKGTSEKENITSIMDIVRGADRKPIKQLGHKNRSDIDPKEKENAAGLRLKKIMRRGGNDQDSAELVQEIRKKIREGIRNKSSSDLGQNLFDPKLLDAFRTAFTGFGAQNRSQILDVKAKKSLLQKGKVRESLTKKIYGTGGKRRRAWTRECEVEFWKHRCIKASRPEKIQTLKSVLDVLRDKSDSSSKSTSENTEERKGSILSRLYLADASVLPRNDDIKPVSVLKTDVTPEQRKESGQSIRIPKQNSESKGSVAALDGKDATKSSKGAKAEKKCPAKQPVDTNVASKSGDKRKWALEVLARKTAASVKNSQENEEDPAILKGNYILLAQLPKEMRPVLAPCRHNKIPIAVRQAQLYRLTEHFLKKANLSEVCRSAETELAVADAVNIEKRVADRASSKLVYLNLCSQELLRRADNVNCDRDKETNPSSPSEHLSNRTFEEKNDSSSDSAVDEALRNAGLIDSPPDSPKRPIETTIDNEGASPEDSDEEGPANVIEDDSHQELDIYGDFEYNLEDDDFIGAGALNVSNPQPEQPKIKLLFSSLIPEKPNGIPEIPNQDTLTDVEASTSSSVVPDSENKTTDRGLTPGNGVSGDGLLQSSSVANDDEPSLAECDELYGPDKEPLIQKYPETVSAIPYKVAVDERKPDHAAKNSGQLADNLGKPGAVSDGSKPSSKVQDDINKKDKDKIKRGTEHSDSNNDVMKKVEAYIKEHLRPLCKSGVITVDQYRWSVGKSTEKVMKYHSKEKNAHFLIKEGEKVKKLAEQYVEAAAQQKA